LKEVALLTQTFGETPSTSDPVSVAGQWLLTVGSYSACTVVIVLVAVQWRRDRCPVPGLILFGATGSFAIEPIYDRLYGLWFHPGGQWNLYTAYGISEPVWVPPVYLLYFGVLTLTGWRALEKSNGDIRVAYRQFLIILVVVVLLIEVPLIKVLGVYNYSGTQPFSFLGYPLHAAITNAVEPVVAAIVIYRLSPLVKGIAQIALALVPPLTITAIAFGTGFIYLAVRHSNNGPPEYLLWIAASTTFPLALTALWLSARLLSGAGPKSTSP
jgi:hypothetical protein